MKKKKVRVACRDSDLIAGESSVLGIYRSAVDSLVGLSCASILNAQFLTFRSAFDAALELSKKYPHLPIAVVIYPDHISCRITVALPYDAEDYLDKCLSSNGDRALDDEFMVLVELPNRFKATIYDSVQSMLSDLVEFCPSSIDEALRVYESLRGIITPEELAECLDDEYGYYYNLSRLDLDFYGFGSFIPRTVVIYHPNCPYCRSEIEIDVDVFVFPPRSWRGFLEFLVNVVDTICPEEDLCRVSGVLSSSYPFSESDYFLSFMERCEQMQSMVVENMSASLDFAYRFATEPTGTILDKFDRLLVVLPDGRIEGFHGAFISASVNPNLHLDEDIARELDRSYYFLVPDCFFDGLDYKYGFRSFMKDFYRRGYLESSEREVYEDLLGDMPSIVYRMNRSDSKDDRDSWLKALYGLDYSLTFDGSLSRWFLNCYILNPKESDIVRAVASWQASSKDDLNVAVELWTLPFPAFEDQGWRKHLDHYKLRIVGQQSLF